MPREDGNDYEMASRSTAAYIERSSHFFVVCPTVKHQDNANVTCDYGSWLQNSGCRFEMFALLLSRHDRPPPIVRVQIQRVSFDACVVWLVHELRRWLVVSQVVKGGDATPFMISPTAAIPRSPGTGRMACCDCGHAVLDAEGVPQPIPCKKVKMGSIMLTLLRSLREYHFGRDELLSFRMFTALMPLLMSGLLPSEGIPTPPRSVAEFLTQYRFSEPNDEMVASGYTPLVCAAASGNVGVVRELVNSHHADVKSQVRTGLPKFGLEKGMDALLFTVCCCPQCEVHEMVSLLLASGADPNLTYGISGGTALMGAVMWHNLEGVRSLISSAGDRLDLEQGLKVNNATAVLVAGACSTFEILDALIQAGANREHK